MNKIMQLTKQYRSSDTIGYVMVFAAGTLWGTIGLFVKLLSSVGASTSLIAFMRLFMGFCILVPVMLCMGGLKMFKIDKNGLKHCLMLGLFSQALFNYCYIISIGSIVVATASILLYTAPVFVCIMSNIIFKEMIGKLKIFALIINIVGCFLMVTGGNCIYSFGYGLIPTVGSYLLYMGGLKKIRNIQSTRNCFSRDSHCHIDRSHCVQRKT